MMKQYGAKKGSSVFYASERSGKIAGVVKGGRKTRRETKDSMLHM